MKIFTLIILFSLTLAALAQAPADTKNAIGQQTDPTYLTPAAAVRRVNEGLHDPQYDPHDIYLALGGYGNEETAALLIKRLHPMPPEAKNPYFGGFVCTYWHMLDALKEITNTHQGSYYEGWARWWQVNQGLSQRQWILNGFAAEGLRVSDPVDETFALQLLNVLGNAPKSPGYLVANAKRSLKASPENLRLGWVRKAAASDQAALRLGAIRDMVSIDTTGFEPLLRQLTKDADATVRYEALAALNDRLSKTLVDRSGSAQPLLQTTEQNRISSVAISDGLVVVSLREGELHAFDAQTRRTLWVKKLDRYTGEHILVDKDRIILSDRIGSALALDRTGRVIWRRTSKDDSGQNEIHRILKAGDDIVLMRRKSIEKVDRNTGATKLLASAEDIIHDADSDGTSVWFLDEKSGLHAFNENSSNWTPVADGLRLFTMPDLLCIATAGSGARIGCLKPHSISLQWEQPIADPKDWVSASALLAYDTSLLLKTSHDLISFAKSDGTVLWKVPERTGLDRLASTPFGFLSSNFHYELELRDPETGEVRKIWDNLTGIRLAVDGSWAVASGSRSGDSETLWIVDLAKAMSE